MKRIFNIFTSFLVIIIIISLAFLFSTDPNSFLISVSREGSEEHLDTILHIESISIDLDEEIENNLTFSENLALSINISSAIELADQLKSPIEPNIEINQMNFTLDVIYREIFNLTYFNKYLNESLNGLAPDNSYLTLINNTNEYEVKKLTKDETKQKFSSIFTNNTSIFVVSQELVISDYCGDVCAHEFLLNRIVVSTLNGNLFGIVVDSVSLKVS